MKKKQCFGLANRIGTLFLIFILSIITFSNGCKSSEDNMTQELKSFITNFENKAASAYKDYALAYFDATISG